MAVGVAEQLAKSSAIAIAESFIAARIGRHPLSKCLILRLQPVDFSGERLEALPHLILEFAPVGERLDEAVIGLADMLEIGLRRGLRLPGQAQRDGTAGEDGKQDADGSDRHP